MDPSRPRETAELPTAAPASFEKTWSRRSTRKSASQWLISGVAGVAMLLLAAGAVAAADYRVAQRDRAFSLKQITVALGDVIHFDNDDDFIHQIYIDSPNFSFDSRETYPGGSIDVTFTQRGTYLVRCHIHPKMSLEVNVK